VHNFCTCEKITAAQWQNPRGKTCFDAGKIGTYGEFTRKNNFLALGVCFPSRPRALAAGLPRQDHVYKTSDESFRFRNKNVDEMRCKLDSTENPRSFEKYPTQP